MNFSTFAPVMVIRCVPLLMLFGFVAVDLQEIMENPMKALPSLFVFVMIASVAFVVAPMVEKRLKYLAGRRSMRAAVGVYGPLPDDTK